MTLWFITETIRTNRGTTEAVLAVRPDRVPPLDKQQSLLQLQTLLQLLTLLLQQQQQLLLMATTMVTTGKTR